MVIKIKKGKSKKKIKKSKDKKSVSRKLFLTGFMATVCFVIITGNLGKLIFVHGKEYSEAAYNNQMKVRLLVLKEELFMM